MMIEASVSGILIGIISSRLRSQIVEITKELNFSMTNTCLNPTHLLKVLSVLLDKSSEYLSRCVYFNEIVYYMPSNLLKPVSFIVEFNFKFEKSCMMLCNIPVFVILKGNSK